ncbi:hypothetical protein Hanom_Chr06g00511351 [Helianthus anomalus]
MIPLNWLITNGLVGAFEYLRQSAPFTALIDRLSAAAFQSGHHDGVYKGYFDCQQSERIASDFHMARGKFQGDMAGALEAAYKEPLPAYADLVDKVNEDGIDSLRLMVDPAEDRKSYGQRLSDIFQRLDAADGLVRLQIPVTKVMIKKRGSPPDVVFPRVSRSCKSVIYENPFPANTNVASLSTDTLMEAIPADHVQRCHLVYERRRGGRSVKNPVGDRGMVASLMVGGHTDDLAVDPCLPGFNGKVLHTPAEVMATRSLE